MEHQPPAAPACDPWELAREADDAAQREIAETKAMVGIDRIVERARAHALRRLGTGASSDIVDIVTAALEEFHIRRMNAVRHDASVVVTSLGGGIAGYFDGHAIVLDLGSITPEVYAHERQHQRDGLPKNLDADLAPTTGIPAIDQRLEGIGTKRDLLEERAMDAAREVPDAYRDTHWQTVKDMEKRGRAVGVHMEAANDALIVAGNEEAYRQKLVELAVREIGKDDPHALQQIAEDAERAGAAPAVLRIIAETRDVYENGPESQHRMIPPLLAS